MAASCNRALALSATGMVNVSIYTRSPPVITMNQQPEEGTVLPGKITLAAFLSCCGSGAEF